MSPFLFNHVSVTCADLDRSLAFYNELLGLPLMDSREISSEESPEHRLIIGLGAVHLRYAAIDLGAGAWLELFEYVEPRGVPVAKRTCDPGDVHFALTVDDIWDVHRRLEAAGVETRSQPVALARGDWKGVQAFYALDPDGVTVEFIEFPPGFDG
jgi:catechol 2,3-dioxygenase-like lactoylglutathione lyase family enzyme